MFKLIRNVEGFSLECESLNNEVTNNVIRILFADNRQGKSIDELTEEVQVAREKAEPKEVVVERQETFKNGTRLPNVSDNKAEVVDLGDVKNGTTNYYKYFMCPDCGQSVLIKVGEQIVIRDITGDTSKLYVSQVKVEKDTVLAMTEEGYMQILNDYTDKSPDTETLLSKVEGLMAECPSCKGNNLLNTWIECFETPLKYFENEKPCPLCGSEMCINVVDEGQKIIRCENKECNYISKEEVNV